MVLKRDAIRPPTRRRPLCWARRTTWFDHQRGLITKSEVRAVTLAKLRLEAGQVLWDLGAGSGSVAIEAALFIGRGQIVAVEKDPRRVEQIKANAKRFGVRQPAGSCRRCCRRDSRGCPGPDRVFIGGGGRDLPAIITEAARCLRPDGIVVVNTVLLQNLHDAASDTLRQLGFANGDRAGPDAAAAQEMPLERTAGGVESGLDHNGSSEGGSAKRKAEGGRRKKNDIQMIQNNDSAFRPPPSAFQHPVLFVGAGPGDPELDHRQGPQRAGSRRIW
ncbi:MAG: precorrin-6Y C5,15-methyltransferase (decarboxylating) subunit CbiT [Desulfobacterales bacterium]|nr:precorrin-6Y C5,15-methyltransferase (decarboxylating) subunit CbiT [Desulfobacterales bacterium]